MSVALQINADAFQCFFAELRIHNVASYSLIPSFPSFCLTHTQTRAEKQHSQCRLMYAPTIRHERLVSASAVQVCSRVITVIHLQDLHFVWLMRKTFNKWTFLKLDSNHFFLEPSTVNAPKKMEQLSTREVESHERAVSKNMLWVYPHCPLRCWRPGQPPVCVCILHPSASPALLSFLHISTRSCFPSLSSELWHAGPALALSALLHFLPLARWPGCPAGAACSPPGQLACLMVPFIRAEGMGATSGKGEGWGSCVAGLVVDYIGIVIK